MNPQQLKKWKEDEMNLTENLSIRLVNNAESSQIHDYFPELEMAESRSTSLEPYLPVWAVLPFYEQVLLNISPHLRTETEFIEWYGLSPKQVLDLADRGRIVIKVIYPKAFNSIPKYLNEFYYRKYPSTLREKYFVSNKLGGQEKINEITNHFNEIINKTVPIKGPDTYTGNSKRIINNYANIFLQLHALGQNDIINKFEQLIFNSSQIAFDWLSTSRLLNIGPTFYSYNGIHSVASQSIKSTIKNINDVNSFPSELTINFIKAFKLIREKNIKSPFNLDDILTIYPNSELARSAFINLKNSVYNGNANVEELENISNLITKAKGVESILLRCLKLIGATSISAASIPLNPAIGLIAGLIVGTLTEFGSNKIDKTLTPHVHTIMKTMGKAHLTTLLDLDYDVKKNFRL